VRVPRTRDRSCQGITFHSSLLPPYLKRTKSLEAVLPWLYLKGLSSGDFQEALSALLGPDAPGLSSASICRLKSVWADELKAWQERDLSSKRYVYFWIDGVYLEARLEERQCMLVIRAFVKCCVWEIKQRIFGPLFLGSFFGCLVQMG
jgi:transposase-like protein